MTASRSDCGRLGNLLRHPKLSMLDFLSKFL
jgi:hypothetical protein